MEEGLELLHEALAIGVFLLAVSVLVVMFYHMNQVFSENYEHTYENHTIYREKEAV